MKKNGRFSILRAPVWKAVAVPVALGLLFPSALRTQSDGTSGTTSNVTSHVTSQVTSDVTGEAPEFSQPEKLPTEEEIEKALGSVKVRVNLVTTPVSVFDSEGELVYDLDRSDFEILDNGIPQEIDGFEPTDRELSLVVVIQTSRIIEPLLPRIQNLGLVLSSLILGPEGEVAVIFFSDRVRVPLDFTRDVEALSRVLKGTKARGRKSRLNDALVRAVSLLRTRERSRKRVILAFSDGHDSGSETAKKQVLEDSTGAEVTIYGVGFNRLQAMWLKKPEGPGPNSLDDHVARPLPLGTVTTPTNSAQVYSTGVPVVPILVASGQWIRSIMAKSLLELYAGYTGGVYYGQLSRQGLENQVRPDFERTPQPVRSNLRPSRSRPGRFPSNSGAVAPPRADGPRPCRILLHQGPVALPERIPSAFPFSPSSHFSDSRLPTTPSPGHSGPGKTSHPGR